MDTTHPTRRRYLTAFKTVAHRFELNPNASNAAAEDYQLVLEGDVPITRFVAVTIAGEGVVAVTPAGDSLSDATAAALASINDEFYPEAPLAVVDLDNGNTYRPRWQSTDWRLDYQQVDVPQRPTGVFDLRSAIEFLETALRPARANQFSTGDEFIHFALAWLLRNSLSWEDWTTENTRHAIALVSNESDELKAYLDGGKQHAFYLAARATYNSLV